MKPSLPRRSAGLGEGTGPWSPLTPLCLGMPFLGASPQSQAPQVLHSKLSGTGRQRTWKARLVNILERSLEHDHFGLPFPSLGHHMEQMMAENTSS